MRYDGFEGGKEEEEGRFKIEEEGGRTCLWRGTSSKCR